MRLHERISPRCESTFFLHRFQYEINVRLCVNDYQY